MIKITDKSFHYTPSFETDLKKKFRRLAAQMRAAEARKVADEAIASHSVVPIARRAAVAGQPKA